MASTGRERVRCAVLIPVLRRPHRVEPLLESLLASSTRVHPVFITSPDDRAEQDAVRATGADMLILPDKPGVGDYAKKVNLAYRETDEPLLFLAADDLRFRKDWLEFAEAKLRPGRIGVVGTNDLGSPRVMQGQHSTHSLVTRAYADDRGTVDGPGQVLAECYRHNFVDDEFIGTAKRRSAWAFARASIVEHLHPSWGKASSDPVYRIGQASFERDRRTFQARTRLWRAGVRV